MASTLKDCRKRLGMSVDDVGVAIGKSPKTVSAWEVGRGQPDADTLVSLASLYGVSVSSFYQPAEGGCATTGAPSFTLKELRKEAGYTQQQASSLSGIALGTLRRWEQGVNEPDMQSIATLARLYGTTTDAIIMGQLSNNESEPALSPTIIGENIKRLRGAFGWTQEQLASKIDVSRAAVTQWETGYSSPRMNAIERLAEVFRVTPSDMLAEDAPLAKNVSQTISEATSALKTLRPEFQACALEHIKQLAKLQDRLE